MVPTWRTYRGRRLGPYYKLAFRRGTPQRAFYLGRSEELADRVRQLLDGLQTPLKKERGWQRLKADARAAFRQSWKELRDVLAPLGIELKGSEFRGIRRAFQRPEFREYVATGRWPQSPPDE